jgi:hypothetical protein
MNTVIHTGGKMKRNIVRQGDVLLVPTTKKPSARAQRVTDKGRVILAYGEVTGHAHEVVGVDNVDNVPPMELFREPDGRRLLVISKPAALRHEEHGAIDLAVGGYEVIRQREYSPEAIRNVAD